VDPGRQHQTRQKEIQAVRAEPLGEKLGDDRHQGRDSTVHDRGAEATDQPHDDGGIRQILEVVGVLYRREAGSDGEAANRRIDEETDPIPQNQIDHHRGLERLLDDRRRLPRQTPSVELERLGYEEIEVEAHAGARGPRDEQKGDEPPRNELEALQPNERGQEGQDRQQSQRDPETRIDEDREQPGELAAGAHPRRWSGLRGVPGRLPGRCSGPPTANANLRLIGSRRSRGIQSD
jgi:hypothetical protein